MAQQDEFEAKAMLLWAERYPDDDDGHGPLNPHDWPEEWKPIADALRAEHTRGDAAGYTRGQISGLQQALALGEFEDSADAILARIAELRKGVP